MKIHYDVTGLLSAVWKVTLRSTCLSYLSWPGRGGGGSRILIAHMRDIQESAGSRKLDRWRCVRYVCRQCELFNIDEHDGQYILNFIMFFTLIICLILNNYAKV